MFRHQGKTRTLRHNKQIASLLSFVAGMVNVAGFLAVKKLTTNVTGHFAFFIDEIFKMHMGDSLVYFLYIFFFFFGSFCSSFLIETMQKKNERYLYVFPALIEAFILLIVSQAGHLAVKIYPDIIAFSLLFSMGLQNALVTRISDAMVRTTHLTGLFTDLGIELSQLFFYRGKEQREKLSTNIRLRLRIILFFFLGGVVGGVLYPFFELKELLLPALLLLAGLYYDNVKYQLLKWAGKSE